MSQQTSSCKHPLYRRQYYHNGTYKCWECLNEIVENPKIIKMTNYKTAQEILKKWLLPSPTQLNLSMDDGIIHAMEEYKNVCLEEFKKNLKNCLED